MRIGTLQIIILFLVFTLVMTWCMRNVQEAREKARAEHGVGDRSRTDVAPHTSGARIPAPTMHSNGPPD